MTKIEYTETVVVGRINQTLRISIPKDVAELMNIEVQNDLIWIADFNGDGNIEIRKKDDNYKEGIKTQNSNETIGKIQKSVVVGKGNRTLRISIPSTIANLAKIREKDKIRWIITNRNGKFLVNIEKC